MRYMKFQKEIKNSDYVYDQLILLLLLADRTKKCTRNSMRSSIWSKLAWRVRNIFTKIIGHINHRRPTHNAILHICHLENLALWICTYKI